MDYNEVLILGENKNKTISQYAAVEEKDSNTSGKTGKKKRDWGFIALLIFTLVYLFSPIDIIPEGILGPLGFADDAALIAYLIKRIIDKLRK